ncbi:fasciclin domain-containing protein [Gramella jeungdoensis]|uniref:Fasciclin domain-containing protein n=1 Tax=Gramella jeungdoensis TaxID=708091 RepID=A0ABT0YWV5_9FLAO|nr:fasciclin domain-containing protein [Gramella jeungdoensis]MCM8567936.1 fasciclin domain-containing protein [Gramella jeungdoensis]
MKMKILFMLLALSAIVFTSCDDNKKKDQEDKERMEQMEAEREAEMNAEKERMEMESNSIAAKAMETDTLSTLVSALQTAEMAELLTVSEGPYTVFAPNNAAFAKVDKKTLDNLMKKENQEDLSSLLEYHVVEDEITSQELVELINDNDGEYTIVTLEGGELKATLEGENVIITDEAGNKAKVVQADVEASNGIVHIIDAVVMKKA